MAPLVDMQPCQPEDNVSKLRWVDLANHKPLAVENDDADDLVNKVNPPMITKHRDPSLLYGLKSNLKGSKPNQ